MERCICFISGPCAAGKSTVGKLLAQHKNLEKASFLEVDEIRRSVWQGYIPPFPETDVSRVQLELAARAVARSAKLYYEAGFWVFIGEVLEPWILPIYREELSECPTRVICLLPSEDELVKRDQSRPKSEQMGERCLELWHAFQEWSKTADWIVIDPTKQKPGETAEKILSLLDTNS